MSMPVPEKTELKQRFSRTLGYWNEAQQSLLDSDPGFLEAALRLAAVPARSQTLTPRDKALIQLAIDVSVTRLDVDAVRRHMARALELGATQQEVLEVCHLASVLGIHACTVAVPILAEELEAAGRSDELGPRDFDPRRETLKANFMENRGYWSPLWDDLLRGSPDFFEAYSAFSSYPWTEGKLEPKVKELVYIAIDAVTTHLFEPGIRIHIRNALGHGATAGEILETLQLATLVGIDSSFVGAAVLQELRASK